MQLLGLNGKHVYLHLTFVKLHMTQYNSYLSVIPYICHTPYCQKYKHIHPILQHILPIASSTTYTPYYTTYASKIEPCALFLQHSILTLITPHVILGLSKFICFICTPKFYFVSFLSFVSSLFEGSFISIAILYYRVKFGVVGLWAIQYLHEPLTQCFTLP